jgi:hypothetical protein
MPIKGTLLLKRGKQRQSRDQPAKQAKKPTRIG